MKKQLLVGLLLSLISSSLLGQITLEHTYPGTASTNSYDNISLTKLSVGQKYSIVTVSTDENTYDVDGCEIKMYNTNHSLFKYFSVPLISLGPNAVINNIYIYNISDNLFSTDSKVEYMAEYNTSTNSTDYVSFIRVFNEDGTVLFSKDSARAIYFESASGSTQSILNTTAGTKMVIQNNRTYDKGQEVYSLPGTLITALAPDVKKNGGTLSNPMPNPSSDVAKVEFTLPEGVTKGEISVYTMNGKIVKKFQVDRAFGYLLLDNSDLEPGTYFYKLEAGNTVAEIQKMLVIK